MSNKPKNDVISSSLQSFTNFNKKTIQDWINSQRKALYGYYNQYPLRQPLIDVFDKITLDPHLSALMQQRSSRVTGEGFEIVRGKEVDVTLTELVTESTWLQQFMEGCMNARWFGYTLFEAYELDDQGVLTELREVNRRNVIPELRIIQRQMNVYSNVIDIDDEEFADSLYLVVDRSNLLGILNKAVPTVLQKFYGQTSWTAHAQRAGLPLLFAKLKETDESKVDEMLDMLERLANDGIGVGGDGDTVEVVNRNGGGHLIYKELIETQNSELTKLIMSQTGTTEANSSHAQSKTHKTVADEIAEADKLFCQNAFNKFIPKLVALGYPLEGCTGRFTKTSTVDEGTEKLLATLLKSYDIDPAIIHALTGIEVETKLSNTKLPTE